MKIAILSHQLTPPLIGGVDVYADRLGRAFQRKGYEVFYLAFDPSGEGAQVTVREEDLDGTPLWRLLFDFDSLPKAAFDTVYNADMGKAAGKIFQDQRPDLVVIINFYMVTMAPVEAAKALGLPVVHVATDFVPVCRWGTYMRWDGSTCTVGESVQTCATCFTSGHPAGRLASSLLEKLPERTIARWAENTDRFRFPDPRWVAKPYLKNAAVMVDRLKTISPLRSQIDLVLVPTQFTYETFVSNGFRHDQVHLLPFGVEPGSPLENVGKTPAGHLRFMFLGRLQPYKGGHLAVEAFNRLDASHAASLTIYGAPDRHDGYFARLQAMMDANERIDFAGLVPPERLAEAFAQADVFLLPSIWHENCPLILLDALQSGTPVIGSDAGGIRGIVEHEVNGLLFPLGDAGALQQAMQRVIDDPGLVKNLRSGKPLLSIDDYAASLLELLEQRAAGQEGTRR